MQRNNYPTWTCRDCAVNAGGQMRSDSFATWHLGRCDVCGEMKTVTEPRDFGYPNFSSKSKDDPDV